MVADELRDDMFITRTPVKLFYNTIDMERYKTSPADRSAARKVLGIDEKEFVVIGNGQIQPRKRFDSFVTTAKLMPDISFIWVGGIPFKRLGAEYSTMKKLVASAPGNLTVTDVIPLQEVRKYLQAADVFYLPAEQENHPMSVLEAAGTGLPIILRDIPQYDDTFAEHAILVASDDQVVKSIRRLQTDPVAYKKAVEGAHATAKRFGSEAGAEMAVRYYREAISPAATENS